MDVNVISVRRLYILAAWWADATRPVAMLAAIWFTAGMRKLVTKSVPGLMAISLMVLTLQTLAAIATGNLLILLLMARWRTTACASC